MLVTIVEAADGGAEGGRSNTLVMSVIRMNTTVVLGT